MSNQNIPDILKKIVQFKQQEIIDEKIKLPIEPIKKEVENSDKCRGFVSAICQKISNNQPAVIAEIKKASPSKGVLREDFNPAEIAKSYADNGAVCLSVLTDRNFFKGDNQHLILAKNACEIPILRKEFIIDEYQIYQAKMIGADCILLIAAILDLPTIQKFTHLAQQLGLDILIEVHNLTELQIALTLELPMIGINNRDLHTFETRLQTTIDLLTHIPNDKIVITESGISKPSDVDFMQKNQVFGFLVGEVFMRKDNPGDELKRLFFQV